MANCKLCNQPKKLVDSHIFPEFMYLPMYDNNHKFKLISIDEGDTLEERKKGIYEKLLCDNCDNRIIGKYENHASKILFGDGKKEIEVEQTKFGHLIHGVDYKLFKLFQISLLWRASISTRREIIRINLGPHAEIMRKMLFNEDPGEVYDYGVLIFMFPRSSKDIKDLITPPELLRKRISGNKLFRALFNGLLWIFFVSSHSRYFEKKEFFLSKEGTLPIINSGESGEQYIFNLAMDFKKRKVVN